MTSSLRRLAPVAAFVLLAGCGSNHDATEPSTSGINLLASAYATPLVGTGGSSTSLGQPAWAPTTGAAATAPGFDALMEGGIGGALSAGATAVGSGACTFSSSTGRVECPTYTTNGLRISTSYRYLDANGQPLAGVVGAGFDGVDARTVISGTVDGSVVGAPGVTTTVAATRSQTVRGLTSGSTRLVVDGTSSTYESVTGSSGRDTFAATRTSADSTIGLTLPRPDVVISGGPSYPTAGRLLRTLIVSATTNNQPSSLSMRREVVTFDGSATAKVVITQDGVTKSCTYPLTGTARLTCQ